MRKEKLFYPNKQKNIVYVYLDTVWKGSGGAPRIIKMHLISENKLQKQEGKGPVCMYYAAYPGQLPPVCFFPRD